MTLFHGTSVFLALQMKIKCEKQIAAIRICRYKHKEIWYTRTACWSCSFSSSTVFAIRTVYASFTRTLQTSHFKEMESYGREKEGLNHVNILLETVDSNIYIYLMGNAVSNIGLMPLLLENAHATALLNRVLKLVKEAVEHLNPN